MTTFTSGLILCPTCRGKRVNRALACGCSDIPGEGQGCRPVELTCYRCDGAGVVPREMLDWMELGARLRARRLRGLGLAAFQDRGDDEDHDRDQYQCADQALAHACFHGRRL